MNLMQLIKEVLDELYPGIPGSDDERNTKISAAIDYLDRSYAQLLNPNRVPIDFARAENRFAYIYKYTTAHADYVMQMFRDYPPLSNLFKKKDLRAACLGGGPGSDFLGILKYMLNHGKSATVMSYLYDKEDTWGESWSEIAPKIGPNFKVFTTFQQIDVTVPGTWQNKQNFLKADLFTFVYFLSELHSFRVKAQPCFDHVFRAAKPGALFLFMDNNDATGQFCRWFEDMITPHNIPVIQKGECEIAFGNEEEKNDIEPYFSRFGWMKRKSNMCFRIARKN